MSTVTNGSIRTVQNLLQRACARLDGTTRFRLRRNSSKDELGLLLVLGQLDLILLVACKSISSDAGLRCTPQRADTSESGFGHACLPCRLNG